MEDSKALQYWTQVHTVGSVVFNDVSNQADSLQTLLNILINGQLLSEIECLSEDVKTRAFPCPFSTWLLQGIFVSAVANERDPSLECLCVESQSKILTAAFHRTNREYHHLLMNYFDAIRVGLSVPLKENFSCFLDRDYVLKNLTLSKMSMVVSTHKQRTRILKLLFRVVEGTYKDCLQGCYHLHPELWEIIFLLSDKNDLLCVMLPLINELLSSDNIPSDKTEVLQLLCFLPRLLQSEWLNNEKNEELFLKVWQDLKKRATLTNAGVDNIVHSLLNVKDTSVLELFVSSEVGWLLSTLPHLDDYPSILNDSTSWNLQDRFLLFEGFVVKDILSSVREGQGPSGSRRHRSVSEISRHWRELMSAFLELVNKPNLSDANVDLVALAIKTAARIVAQVEKVVSPSNCSFQFFAEKFIRVLIAIAQHIQKNEVACIAFAYLMNLPEAGTHPEISYRDHMKVIVKFLSELPPTKHDTSTSYLLRGLRNVPPGIPPEFCINLFVQCASSPSDVPLVVVESVPFLYLTDKTSATYLIADILLPVILCERDDFRLAAVEATSHLVCALAGTAYIFREEDELPVIKCWECCSNNRITGTRGSVDTVENHLNHLFSPIFSSSTAVKCRFLSLVPKLSTHLRCFQNSDMIKKFLTFLSDPSLAVRREFGKCVNSLIFGRVLVVEGQMGEFSEPLELLNTDPNVPALRALNMIFDGLAKEINAQMETEQWGERLETLLVTLINIASFPSRAVLKQSMNLLLLFVGICPIPFSSFISSISFHHKTTPLILYYWYKPEISQFFGHLILRNVKFGCPARLTLSSSMFFKGLSKTNFANGSGPFIIPTLVQAAAKQEPMKVLLQDYADYFEEPVSVVITKTFSYIYVGCWLSCDPTDFKLCMDLIEQLVTVKIPDLVLHSQKNIIHQFLFNFQFDENRVLKGLSHVIGGLSQASTREQIASSLESRFVGYLLFLVGKFTKEENAESEKVQALQSLTAVLNLMGKPFVTPVARKVLATLITMHSLNHYSHAGLLCTAWTSFVRGVKSQQLGPLLATIVVTILPLMEHDEDGVLRILKYLLVEEKRKMTKYISNLVFLKNLSPALKPITDSIDSCIAFPGEDIKDRLTRETALATHETVGVRVEGLKALLSTFKSSATEVQSLIIGSDEADNCVTTLWEALLMGCRDSDPKISNIAALCLGELGAVDPSLLPRSLKAQNVLPLSAHDPEFGFLALSEILRGFQNARTSVDMDAFAIGIQELLKIYSVTEADNNPTWMKFSTADHSLLRPMLSSRYTVQAPIRDKWPAVIFGTREAGSHMTWAPLWASKLISLCSDSRAVLLFRACEPSMKRDPKILLFFLKYILLHVITQDRAHHDAILKEMVIVTSLSSDYCLKEETGAFLPIRMIEYCGYPSIRTSMTDTDERACAMTMFLLIDFLNYWARSYLSQHHTLAGDHLQRRDYCLVQEFLEKIDLKKVATANFELQEYPRTIQCIEEIVRKNPESLSEHLHILSKSYALHGDLDSVGGARTLQKSDSNIEEQLFYRQMSRQLEEARILYEHLGKIGMSPKQAIDMIQCYIQLGEPTVAYSCIQKQIQERPELEPVYVESMTECMLKLGDWTALVKTLDSDAAPNQRGWYMQLGKIAHSLREGALHEVDRCLKTSQSDLVQSFTSLGAECGNESGYNCLIRLQILNEVERVRQVVILKNPEEVHLSLKSMFKEWDAKMNLVQSSGDCLEQVLSTRRTLLNVLSTKLPERSSKYINDELGKYWVRSAEVARKAGCFHQAYNYIVSAEKFNIPSTFIEKSKLLWDKGNKEESLAALTQGMSTYFPDVAEMKTMQSGSRVRLEERKMAAEALLLYAIYNEETSNCSSSTNICNYQDAYEVCRELEKTQAMLAQCIDRCLPLLGDTEEDVKTGCEFRFQMVNFFGKSLLNGCEYIYQTVPRMLSIWFDLGEKQNKQELHSTMTKINKLMRAYVEKLPPFVFMTALPQLLSRIAHPNREVFSILKLIIVTLIRAFPQQCLWAIQTLAKSSVDERSYRYKEIIQEKALQADGLSKLIQDFTSLCDKLNRLTNINLPQDSINRTLLVSNVMRDLPKLFKSDNFSPIIVPITRFCAISLPKDVTSSMHQPFPKNPVTIAAIQNEMTVLPSLQRPRKISFLGTDGKLYDILCKPKDDLRRDARLMEFNNIVNMYLHRDPESRARQLHIRTYVVTPLGESGGLLEWVPQLVGLRPALFQLYKQRGKFVPPRDIRKFDTNVRDSLAKKKEMLVDNLLPLHPPIFHEWFRLNFPDPVGWYAARLAYIRTTAVMSMVGYILGLGDRHGENILYDCESGDTVHVDFNCLFNKGEQFAYRERVPFRLTHNMVSAMGPCGVEGTFRKSCETSMRVLRAQEKTLMSVLTPSAYDPFGSWGKNKQIIQQDRDKKIAEALEELRDIEKRLKGSLRLKQKNDTFYLSVEGLVKSLIAEATSVENLSQMYLGWGAYL